MESATNDERTARENGWVREIWEGKKEGFEALYRFYYPRLCQFVFRYVKSKATAEDVVHNVFHKVWKNRAGLKANGKLRAYLYTAVRNESFKHLNKRKKDAFAEFDDLTFLKSREINPEDKMDAKEFQQAVQVAISKLPERRRSIFLMSREDKLTYREIAEVLDLSIKTVETQISRSLKHLRKELAHFISSEGISI